MKSDTMTHQVVRFVSDGSLIEGDLFVPEASRDGTQHPAVVLAQGFTVPRFLALPEYARFFAEEGFASLVIDYRGWGSSDGERHRLIPMEQVDDLRNAVSYLETRPDIDPARIGLWGASFGGANVVCAAGLDDRVKAVVSQVGFGDGLQVLFDSRSPTEQRRLVEAVKRARCARVLGEPEETTTTVEILNSTQVAAFVEQACAQAPDLTAKLSWRTVETMLEYRPIDFVQRISPRPILFVASARDDICTESRIRELYERASDPKEFVSFDVEHYAMYAGEAFLDTAGEAIRFFEQHL